MEKEKHKQILWFLTNRQLTNCAIMLIVSLALNLAYVFANLQFLAIQKAVQEGNLTEIHKNIPISNWNAFLIVGIVMCVLEISSDLFKEWFELKENVYLRLNLFKRYRKIFQIFEKAVRLKMEFVARKVRLLLNCFYTSINIFLVIKTAKLIEFHFSIVLGSCILLISSFILGIYRGRKNAAIMELDSIIKTKENDLTKFFTFSKSHLNNALTVLQMEYDSRNNMYITSSLLANLPYFFKAIIVVVCTFGMVKTVALGEVYSNFYIIFTAFGTILSIAKLLSSITEDFTTCQKLSKNETLKELDNFELKEKLVLSQARKDITHSEDKMHVIISKEFTADLEMPGKQKSFYSLKNDLHINLGDNILVTGPKGSGKTRILQIIEALYEDHVMIYNDHTKVFDDFQENFKSSYGFNYKLVIEIAKGLKLQRLLIPKNELLNMDFHNLNTGDMHLIVALIMLYYAKSNPNNARIMIFDELLANIDTENAKDILEYIISVGGEIGSTIIFVGHGQQEMIKKYCKTIWTFDNIGTITTIEEIKN